MTPQTQFLQGLLSVLKYFVSSSSELLNRKNTVKSLDKLAIITYAIRSNNNSLFSLQCQLVQRLDVPGPKGKDTT